MDNEHDSASPGSLLPARARLGERARRRAPREGEALPLPPALMPRDPNGPQPLIDSCGVSVERLRHEDEQAWYNELQLLAPMAYFLIGFDCAILQANLVGADLLGLTRQACTGQRFRDFIHRPFLIDWESFLERALNSHAPVRCMLALRCQGQTVQVTVIGCADGGAQACRVSVERAEGRLAALERSEERFRRIVHSAQEGIWEIDADTHTTFVNPRMAQMLGYRIEEMMGRPLADFMDQEGRALVERDLARRQQGVAERHSFRFLHKDGRFLWTSLATNPIFDSLGHYMGALALVSDAGERRDAVSLAWQQSNRDSLTGLLNLDMFMDRLALDMRKADRSAGFVALALLDLDHFKDINVRFGPELGDTLLAEAARRIGSCVRATDTLGRTGGDSFGVVLAGLDHVGSVERIAEAILAALAQPFELNGRRVFVSASIGIALYPPDARDIDALMASAGQALRAAKAGGRSRFAYAQADLQEGASTRQSMGVELRAAIAAHQFEVWYQPIVALASGKIVKAEALLRWRHPQRGLLAPAAFIPFAESNGLIVDIGDWVFRQVARQVQQWQRGIDPAFQVSVNKSPLQFRRDADGYQGWHSYLRQLGLPDNSIVIEITESALMGAAPHVLERLRQYRAMGVQVALDDFGLGYASLSHLARFAVDYVKIDQSFVARIEDDAGDLAVCEAIIAMAHALGLKVVAEGVETRLQRALLIDAGCDYAQGYMFAHPLPPAEFEAMASAAAHRLPH